MSRRHSPRISDNEKEHFSLQALVNEFKEMRREMNEEKANRELQNAVIQNELKLLREKSRESHSDYSQEGGIPLSMGDYYTHQPSTSRRHRRNSHAPPPPKEVNVVLPHFHGKDNVEAYLDWEMKVEQLFACHQVSEERKISLATLTFQGYAMYWWTALVQERLRHQAPPIHYWNDLKSALRRRHIPSYYNRELMDKLQRLQQRSMTVEEYRQKMELYMMRAGIVEGPETTLARFLSGLNFEIRDRVELLPYRDLNDLVQMCIKVEQQNLRKSSSKRVQVHPTFEK